jgi:MFS family permease
MSEMVPRRLLVIASLIVVQDLAFFAAISPLLPQYVDDLGLSETEAGVLTAAYPAGTLLMSLPAGFLAARAGPRLTVVVGLVLMGASSIGFGFGNEIGVLDAARFLQGVAGAMTWAGAFTWVIEAEGGERRGEMIGTLLGIAIAGALLGPPLGALADALGTEPVFGSVLVISLVLAAMALRVPEPGARTRDTVGQVARALRGRPVMIAGALLAVPSVEFGAIGVLVPLKIDDLGGGAFVIAVGFTIGAAVEAALSPRAGRYADEHSWLAPYVLGLLISAIALGTIGAVSVLAIVVAAVVGTSIGAGICFTPATKAISDAIEATGLHQGMTAGITNFGWAGGEVVGATVGGAAADAYGLGAAFAGVAIFLSVAALLALRAGSAVVSRAPSRV